MGSGNRALHIYAMPAAHIVPAWRIAQLLLCPVSSIHFASDERASGAGHRSSGTRFG